MPWPLSQDYNEAIQSPDSSFADPELRGGQPTTNAMGMPMPRSGNFADVYEFIGASRVKWAIKCFTREVSGLQERYSEISKHLVQAKLPFTVDFKYLEKGIRIGGQWYPILKMQWVDGFLLNEFVRSNLAKPALLEGLGQIWLRMSRRLREANLAHADLQHGNVILVPGSKASSLAVKLIDYDGMWVPALANKKSGEVGHPAYQHPLRLQQGTYSAEVDRLPLLAIACALRCLAVGGKPLWDRFDNGDNMLFREADLRKPAESALFKELWNIEDVAAHELTGHLAIGLTGSIAQVPLLQDLMDGRGIQPLAPAQERQVTDLLGPGAVVRRPPAIATAITTEPIKTLAASVPMGASFTRESSDSDNSMPIRRSKSSGNLLKIGIAAAVVLVVLIIFATVGVGAWFALNRKEPDKTDSVFVQKESLRNEKKPIRDNKPDLRKEEKGKEDPSGPAKIRPTIWRSLASMPTARSMLATVTGPDGRIYAIGGANASGRLDTVEAYDPSIKTWAKAAPMPTARNHLAATVGPDNRIYAIGGHSSIPNIVEAYNPSTNEWTKVASTPTARHGLAAATGPDGRIYAIGGNGPGGSLSTVEAYDTKTNTWTTVATMPTARVYLAAATGPDGRIYAIGGFVEKDGKRLNTVEAYDTKTNTWTAVAPMPTARNVLTAATGPDGRIYAIGGHPVGGIGNIVEAYSPSTNTWTTAANMPTVRGELASTTGRDGRIYVIGGGNVSYLNTVEALSFSTSKP